GNGHTLTKIGNNEMGARGDSTGSIIHWVIDGGMLFAQTLNRFGAAGSSVTVNPGAAVSHFRAATTFDVPLTINGGILRSGTFATTSSNTGTWTGDLSVSGNVTLDAVGGPLEVKSAITGAANVTKAGANPVII